VIPGRVLKHAGFVIPGRVLEPAGMIRAGCPCGLIHDSGRAPDATG